MGTDIHLMIEYKSLTREAWFTLFQSEELPIPRNYHLFSVLANVRNADTDYKFVDEPRGLPHNTNSNTKMYLYSTSDFYSHSWISKEEYHTQVQGISQSLDYLIQYLETFPWAENWRLVFAFDN